MSLQTLADSYDSAEDTTARQVALRNIVAWIIGQQKAAVLSDITALTNPQGTKDLIQKVVDVNSDVFFGGVI